MTRYGKGRRAARGSLATVIAAAALVAGTLAATAGAAPSDDAADAQKNSALVKSGPMTPEKAQLLGKSNIDFGPNCDTTTERVKIPIVYSPPCAQPFTGKNGGAKYGAIRLRSSRIGDGGPHTLSSTDGSQIGSKKRRPSMWSVCRCVMKMSIRGGWSCPSAMPSGRIPVPASRINNDPSDR